MDRDAQDRRWLESSELCSVDLRQHHLERLWLTIESNSGPALEQAAQGLEPLQPLLLVEAANGRHQRSLIMARIDPHEQSIEIGLQLDAKLEIGAQQLQLDGGEIEAVGRRS